MLLDVDLGNNLELRRIRTAMADSMKLSLHVAYDNELQNAGRRLSTVKTCGWCILRCVVRRMPLVIASMMEPKGTQIFLPYFYLYISVMIRTTYFILLVWREVSDDAGVEEALCENLLDTVFYHLLINHDQYRLPRDWNQQFCEYRDNKTKRFDNDTIDCILPAIANALNVEFTISQVGDPALDLVHVAPFLSSLNDEIIACALSRSLHGDHLNLW
jgi:hypothetical protein